MQEEVIINMIEANNAKMGNIEEKQDIIEDSIQNKYNQLSKTVGKIHQNVKSNNHKYSQIMENLNQMKTLFEHNDKEKLESKIDELLEQFDSQYDMADEIQDNHLQLEKESIRFEDYKLFMNKWFNKNLKITKNPHHVVDMEEIRKKMEKYLLSEEINLDKEKLFNRLESYLKYWYDGHETNICFKDIISTSINNKKLYSYLKFINITEERENRIKNSIIAWLKEHTCEVEGAKTYTEDILKNIQPIFEENGWIITNPEEYNQLQQAGFTKVCVKRTFSQIIGKSVQDLYTHINKDTTKRDVPCNGHVTWYPGIKIINRKVSDNVQITIKDQLSNDIFDSDNMICKWLENNLEFTGNQKDTINRISLLDKLRKYLKKENAMISEDTLQRVFDAMLVRLVKHYNVGCDAGDVLLRQFRLQSDDRLSNILHDWFSSHMVFTGDSNDKVYLDSLDEKLLTVLYKKNIIIIKDDMYQQLPKTIKNNFIQESQYKDTLNNILEDKVSEYIKENTYIESSKIVEYNNLKREDVTRWVQSNIEQLLKNNVSNRKEILENFKQHLTTTNTRNNTTNTLEELLDQEIQTYYNKQNTTLKLLNDSKDEYYVLIN